MFKKHEEELFDHAVDYSLNYIEYNQLFFSFQDHGIYFGTASSSTYSSTININLLNGEPFELKDLFRSGYAKVVSELAISRIRNSVSKTLRKCMMIKSFISKTGS